LKKKSLILNKNTFYVISHLSIVPNTQIQSVSKLVILIPITSSVALSVSLSTFFLV